MAITPMRAVLIVTTACVLLLGSEDHVLGQIKVFSEVDRELLRKAKTIRITVSASSWRGKPNYDIRAALTSLLSEVGFTVVSEVSRLYDATVAVDYREDPKPGYGVGGRGEGLGTIIRVAMKLVHPHCGHILEVSFGGETPSFTIVESDELYESAVRSLEKSGAFRLLGVTVARSLEFRRRFRKFGPVLQPRMKKRRLPWTSRCLPCLASFTTLLP